MGIISSLRSIESPSTTLSDPMDWLIDSWGGSSASGQVVNEQTALTISAVWACTRILSESIASLPLAVFERTSNGKKLAVNHYLYQILHSAPNEEMTSFSWREATQAHITLRGNGYGYINRNKTSMKVKGITLLSPDTTKADRINGRLVYKVKAGSEELIVNPVDILHIGGLGFDGITGYSPIRVARDNLGLSLATQEFGGKFFKNGATLSGMLEHPGKLSDEGRAQLKRSWAETYSGTSNAFKTAVLEEGMKYNSIGIPPEDAQYLQTRKFQLSEIARIYRIPPHMLADLEKATFSNIEQQSIEFVVHTIRPWLVRWEQELNRKLLSEADKKKYFIEFKIDGLLRGDQKSRYESYQIGKQNGFLSTNDIRILENMNVVKGGDVYLNPMNMAPARSDPIGAQQETKSHGIIEQSVRRIVRKEALSLQKAFKDKSTFPDWFKRFAEKHIKLLKDSLCLTDEKAENLTRSIETRLAEADSMQDLIDNWGSERINELLKEVT